MQLTLVTISLAALASAIPQNNWGITLGSQGSSIKGILGEATFGKDGIKTSINCSFLSLNLPIRTMANLCAQPPAKFGSKKLKPPRASSTRAGSSAVRSSSVAGTRSAASSAAGATSQRSSSCPRGKLHPRVTSLGRRRRVTPVGRRRGMLRARRQTRVRRGGG
jgi:hypothetical protein